MDPRLSRSELDTVLAALAGVLVARGLRYELVVIGGASLLFRGIVDRPTRDVDVLGARLPSGGIVKLPLIPAPLAAAAADVGRSFGLATDWFNLGPASLLDLGLPPGFDERLEPQAFDGLVIWFAGRYDLVCFKLYAAVDRWPSRDRHLADLKALAPAPGDLIEAARWTLTHDPSTGFREHLDSVLRHLGIEDPDERLR